MASVSTERYDADWQSKYRNMVMTAEQAVSHVRPGQRVLVGTGGAQPLRLVRALVARHTYLADLQVLQSLTFGEAPYALEELSDYFSVNTFFVSANIRSVVQKGYGHYTPISLSEIPRLLGSGELPLDVAMIQVSPPDAQGRCSLGISVDIVKSAAANAGLVIAQVNPQMPWTLGNSFLSVLDLDILVPADEPLIEATTLGPVDHTSMGGPAEPAEDVVRAIGQNVASLVEDGSTLELGLGHIPQAVIPFLKKKTNLGIHSELITDAIIDLIESGAITGSQKSTDRGKIVTSLAIGTKRLYDYVDNNPRFSFNPTEYVNDPLVIGQQNKMVAVNTALEVDLTGQVCADSLGTSFYSGVGGQADFSQGAGRSPGGRVIIALPSTADGGSVSRIVAPLKPGAGVVTTRVAVHYVVTEYGIAYLRGKNVQERVMALITIAHPDFREELLTKAVESHWVHPEMADVEGRFFVGPEEVRTTTVLDDGTQISFRAMGPTDEPATRDLFYSLSRETLYYRYMSHLERIPRKQLRNYVYIDHRNEVAIVGTLREAHGEEIIAIGGYYLDQKTNRAEVAFIVRDDWQRRGIGTFIMKHLIGIAKRNGIAGFTAEVLIGNKPMQAVLDHSALTVRRTVEEGVVHYDLDF
ncbi:MAG: GNAT family N-acetyltransferase [Actinobacteria bacterium]|nr:GNAT family N-acetyltransferase [Actinomycetota bacterium]